ncbi:MAG: galactose mutarotase [Firmicutes bacterium]|nr:galactose mutarotase [Bacillota bacterium]
MMKIIREHKITEVGEIEFITLKSEKVCVELTSYGAAIYQIYFNEHEMLLSPQDLNTFLKSSAYYGKTVGRVSGRLAVPSYQIDEKSYIVEPVGAPKTNIHGGKIGFSFKNFEITNEQITSSAVSVTMKYFSKNGEENFPGNLTLFVTYTLNNQNELRMDYDAQADADTLCNITCHPYFNFQKDKTKINKHMLTVQADHYLNIDADYLILAKAEVKNTPYDFREQANLGERIAQVLDTPFEGFDHCWVFNHKANQVDLYNPESKLGMKVDTNYPSIVMYTHNIPELVQLEQVSDDAIHSSIALECQYEPGGIHHDYLNSAILRKNEVYKHYISYQFYRKD